MTDSSIMEGRLGSYRKRASNSSFSFFLILWICNYLLEVNTRIPYLRNKPGRKRWKSCQKVYLTNKRDWRSIARSMGR
ncbi:hypothetical protein BDV37DRAFT_263785 [Aspergillus pseudonomiae]|uniref:Uncharacterized protein n=1 Tax=Aspergillus pseudonomiae TaxID=1506151 RepID=A0A5N7CX94_9EURO|nr:uncharacterized protein BDV37DRAFT_263785 [Aspergillus pseudonomiae]KAE8398213.1 hypothetical protein BDV37DRAFT_263785 [Aspergillus pseudonomiae]